MLALKHRLKKVRDFNLLMQQGRWVTSGGLRIRYLDLKRLPGAVLPRRVDESEFKRQIKCAFSVGLKVSKKAVVRNRLRRRLREIVRLLVQAQALKQGFYIVFVGSTSLLNLTSVELRQLVVASLREARLVIS